MDTAILTAEINKSDIPFFKVLLEKVKARKVSFKENKDDTEMSKKEFFDMVDKAMEGKAKEVSMDEMEKLLLE